MTVFDKDSYRTPKYSFNWLEYRFYRFHIDGCSNGKDSLCPQWIGKGSDICEDFLSDELFDRLLYEVIEHAEPLRIFVNPPYSNPLPFVERAAALMKQGYLVVMLLPADKSTKWYQVIQDNATEVIDIVGGRINFIHPITGEEVKGNNKGSMVAVFDPSMQGFVTRSVSLEFIKKVGMYEPVRCH